jgi:type I restriction enzyme S subunit
LAKLGTGHTPSRQHAEYWENCTIPWLTLADVWQLRDGTKQVISETSERISELGLANSAAVLHPAGTVALSRTASVGFTCILGRDMATSQDFATWTCGPGLLPRFVLWALRGTIDEIVATTMGSTHKTIYMPDIQEIAIPLPPVETQVAISDFLDSEIARIDALVGKKRRMIDLARERVCAVADTVLWSDVDREIPLMHAVQIHRPVMYGIVLPGPDVGEGGIAIVKGGDVGAGLSLDRLARTTAEIERPYARARLRPDDVLFAIRGGVGDAAIVPPELEGANITQDVARVAPGAEFASEWVLHVLRSETFQRRAKELVRGATITGLNIRDLERIRIPWAERARQEADLRVLRPVTVTADNLQHRLQRQIDLLREHRRALISAAVTGALDVAKAAA